MTPGATAAIVIVTGLLAWYAVTRIAASVYFGLAESVTGDMRILMLLPIIGELGTISYFSLILLDGLKGAFWVLAPINSLSRKISQKSRQLRDGTSPISHSLAGALTLADVVGDLESL